MRHQKRLFKVVRLNYENFGLRCAAVVAKIGGKKIALRYQLPGIALLGIALCVATPANAANWYVDRDAQGSNNGTSWTNAWTGLDRISGISAGDSVYMSGGSTSTTYTVSSSWKPIGGSSGNPITYKVGQESGHSGTVILDCGGGFLNAASYTIISGDAGDGKQHIQLSNAPEGVQAVNHIRYSYIAFGTVTTMIYVNGVTDIEVDHCTARTTTSADRLAYWEPSAGTGYGANKVHDNYFILSNNGPGIGADGFQGNNSYTDFYNNYFLGVDDNYSSGQHQDAHQPLWGNYIRIWNSKYENIANYPIFFDGYYNDFSHVRIYNNLIVITSSAIQNGSPQGIAIGPDGGQQKKPIIFTDIVVANNTIVDFGTNHSSISMYNPGSTGGTWVDCYVYNNAIVNSAAPELNASVANSNNVVISLSSNNGHFVRFAPLATDNDFHLASTDSSFRDAGVSLSSYFTTDKDGYTRAGTWDVGAYEFHSGVASPQAPKNIRVLQ